MKDYKYILFINGKNIANKFNISQKISRDYYGQKDVFDDDSLHDLDCIIQNNCEEKLIKQRPNGKSIINSKNDDGR